MTVRVDVIVLALALLIWAGPSAAQATFTATVSVHRDLRPLSDDEVSAIMDKASHALTKIPGGQACPVTLQLNGPVRTFGSADAPSIIRKEVERDAVHKVDLGGDASFHIKVVKAINFCTVAAPFEGCAWPVDYPSIIVVHPDLHTDARNQPVMNYPDHLLWVHEFGHLTGRSHTPDPGRALLMTGCALTLANTRVTQQECSCLLRGPGACGKPIPRACQN